VPRSLTAGCWQKPKSNDKKGQLQARTNDKEEQLKSKAKAKPITNGCERRKATHDWRNAQLTSQRRWILRLRAERRKKTPRKETLDAALTLRVPQQDNDRF